MIGCKGDSRHVARSRKLTRPRQAIRIDEMAVHGAQLAAFAFINAANEATLPASFRARHTAASLQLCTNIAAKSCLLV